MSGPKLLLVALVLLVLGAAALLRGPGSVEAPVFGGDVRAGEIAPLAPELTAGETERVDTIVRDAVPSPTEITDADAEEAIAADRIEVVVTVVNESGARVEGIDVVAEVADPDETRSLTRSERKGVTDTRGEVTLRLFDGLFFIGANRRESEPGLTSQSISFDLDPAMSTARITLRRKAATLHVICVDDRNRPVEGANISLYPDEIKRKTGPDGRVTIADLPVGIHNVRLESSALSLAHPFESSREVDLPVGAREIVRFRLTRLGALRIRLEPPPPLDAEAAIRTLPRARDWEDGEQWLDFDANGVVELPLAPGRYGLAATFSPECRFHQRRSVEATVRVGETTEVAVPIREYDGVLSGRVVDPDGRPVSAVQLRIQSTGSEGFKWGRSDSDGAFRFIGLPDLAVKIWADRRYTRGPDAEPRVSLEGPRAGVEIRLERIFQLDGTITRSDGDTGPLEGLVILFVESRNYERGFGWIGATNVRDGRFSFGRIDPGRYRFYYGRPPARGEGDPLGRVVVSEHSPPVVPVHLTVTVPSE